MSGFAPRVRAVLGPTNTGKTRLAIDRLLAHRSGVIGFPLRLLARENYDRMAAAKGHRHVALITGEEKIVPPEARWFSCTVEAMPLDRAAEFVAVDEIQLCADADRGHVFTDRLLHARGTVETMVLGAETIRPLLRRLVPSAEIETRPRLSSLLHAGATKLSRLPPRTALVAFSAAEVYALAELMRRRRGGCAVVMGQLSPRTRNAQVALYQDKEVDFLVATDAIGMGLNMDVHHVAFASLRKFDGHRLRPLDPAECAQIAGRAGRGMRDGTFGTTGDCPPMPEDLVEAVETHRFDPIERLAWRNSDLDFSSVAALIESLAAPPPRPGLARGNPASDLETLDALARDDSVRALATGRQRVRLLWESCQIPDFRKLADETHARLCARVFTHLVRDGSLPADWIAGSLDGLDRDDGDIDTLMARMTGIRVWAYIAARPDWVPDARAWQARAQAIEDKLSDALHEKLTIRFVDRRAAHLIRQLDADAELLSAVTVRGEVVVEGHAVGHVAGFGFVPDPAALGEERRLVLRAARRALHTEMPRRVEAMTAAPDPDFALTPVHAIVWNGATVGRLRPGRDALHPVAEALDSEFLDGVARERVRARLQRWIDATVAAALPALAAPSPVSARGEWHRLRESLGVVPTPGTTASAAPALRAAGARAGRHALFLPALLKPAPMAFRARLQAIARGEKMPALPDPGLVSVPVESWPAWLPALGWVHAGPLLVRLDIAERIAAELAWLTRRRPAALPAGLASRLSVGAANLPAVLRGLGFWVRPAAALAPDRFGPPAPPMVQPIRRPADRPAPAAPIGPFAALASLRPRPA